MWKKATFYLVLASLGLNLAFVGVWAAHAWPARPTDQPRSAVWCPLHRALEVTPRQWAKIEPRLREFQTTVGELCDRTGEMRSEVIELIAAEEPDLAMIHLPGLDAVSHRFLAPAAPGFFSELPDEALRFGEILPRYYEFIDRAVTRILRLTDDETVVVLCSTYGTSPSLDVPRISGAHEGGPPGVFVVKGPRISPLPDPIAVTSNDVAPTILAILGVEIPDDIDGRVVLEVLPAGLAKEHPPEFGPAPEVDRGTDVEPPSLAAAREAAASRLQSLRSTID